MLVLALETSCDETAAAVVERLADGAGRILSSASIPNLTTMPLLAASCRKSPPAPMPN